MGRVLEFMGPAGVGKTTLQNFLVESGGIEGLTLWPWEVQRGDAQFPKKWRDFDRIVRILSRRLPGKRAKYLRGRMVETLAMRRSPGPVFHSREGLANACLGVIGDRAGDELRAEYYQLLPRPLGVVAVTADPEVVAIRYAARAEVDVTPELVERAGRAVRNTREAVEILSDRGVPCLVVDSGRDSLEENSRQVRSFAREILCYT